MTFPCTILILKLGFNNVTSGGEKIMWQLFYNVSCLLLDLYIHTYHPAPISGKIGTIIMLRSGREKGQGATRAQLARCCSLGCPIISGGGLQETIQVNMNAHRNAMSGLKTCPKSCIKFSGN